MMSLSRVSGRFRSSCRRRQDSGKLAAVVDDVDIEDHLQIAGVLELPYRFLDRSLLAQREDLGAHDPPGGLLGILEEVLDLGGFLGMHRAEDGLLEIARQPGHEWSGVVGIELLQESGDFRRGEVGKEECAALRTELGERRAGESQIPLVKRLERLATELLGKIGEDAGDVSGMETIEDVERVDIGAASDELPHRLGEQRSPGERHGINLWERGLSCLGS